MRIKDIKSLGQVKVRFPAEFLNINEKQHHHISIAERFERKRQQVAGIVGKGAILTEIGGRVTALGKNRSILCLPKLCGVCLVGIIA